ncbi:MAG: hypothetical protein B9S36_05800 [Verrucomicrobiia bacterium Tous-C2TDCM]|nr:MAG: hypothetical protein B9S36_05800 [Verrucomicrobiae bacterium Tous-C2TDCM]
MTQSVRDGKGGVARGSGRFERIDDLHPVEILTIVQVFREDGFAARDPRGFDDRGIPPRQILPSQRETGTSGLPPP